MATLVESDHVDLLTRQVQESLRQRGLDPERDEPAVGRVVDEVLAAYEARSLAGAAPVLLDPDAARGQVVDAVCGFGPLQRLLDDPDIEEIWINDPGRVFVARRGRSELTTVLLTASAVRDLVERMLRTSGRRVDLSQPFVDAGLPDGSRLHVAIPDVTREHWAVNIRKFVARASDLHDLVGLGTLTEPAAELLEASVAAGLTVLVAGSTQAGKTTLLNCLGAAIPAQDRVITCEEVFELQLPVPDLVGLQTRQANLDGAGEIRLRHLVKEALRMRPSRLVVGEVRGEECLDLLIALNSGVPGMATVHANSAREAVTKLCTLPLLAGENVTHSFVVPTVAAAVDLVVHTGIDADGRRRVREIVGVPGRVDEGVIELEEIFVRRDGALQWAGGFPPHLERFIRIGVDPIALLRGGRR